MVADVLHRLEIACGAQSPRSQGLWAPGCPRACLAIIAGDDGDTAAGGRFADCRPRALRPVRLGFRLEEEFFLRTRHSGAPYCRRSGLDLR
jgi:hypothetical protein